MTGGDDNHATRGFVLDCYMGTGTMSIAGESRHHGAGLKGNLCTKASPTLGSVCLVAPGDAPWNLS